MINISVMVLFDTELIMLNLDLDKRGVHWPIMMTQFTKPHVLNSELRQVHA